MTDHGGPGNRTTVSTGTPGITFRRYRMPGYRENGNDLPYAAIWINIPGDRLTRSTASRSKQDLSGQGSR